ncbi:MAG: hypothetical protein IKY98_05035, partial [Alphaproteobacteria bacterium]|nr:hypothetical protein [Alphaproteobacteria bacterium]
MKKIIITTCAILMMSVTANACGGIMVKGNSGADYCLSKHTMNWYSAYAWCKDQKMRLIDVDTVCKSTTSCPELNLSNSEKTHLADNGVTSGKFMWTSTAISAGNAYAVDFYNH